MTSRYCGRRDPRVSEDIDGELRGLALDLAADAAEVLAVGDIGYKGDDTLSDFGEVSLFWPRAALGNEPLFSILKLFDRAIAFKVPSAGGSGGDFEKAIRRTYEIAGCLESHCFYRGYYMAAGLAAGNCKSVFCRNDDGCRALRKGRGCRYPLVARPGLEACGIDIRALAGSLGWQATGETTFAMGMVFVD